MTETSHVQRPDPGKIMQVGMGYWASKVLLSAVHHGLFTLLARQPMPMRDIKQKMQFGTTDRHVFDWLDALVSLGFLDREGLLGDAVYSNSADVDVFLDENKPSYIGGILKMSNNRLYNFWGHLDEGLQSGKAQNESRGDSDMSFFNDLYKDTAKLSEFIEAMSGIQKGNFSVLVEKFNFGQYHTMADIGGADGYLSCRVAAAYPSVTFTTYDLLPVAPIAEKQIETHHLSHRIKVESGDFLKDPIPQADIITMGNILHGLNEDTKLALIKKAYAALPAGGALMVIENIIDNERRTNTFGMLMSLNMLIENGDAFDYTMKDFDKWTSEAGFKRTELIPLAGPTSAAVAYK